MSRAFRLQPFRVATAAAIMLVFSAISLLHCSPTNVVVADLSGLHPDGGGDGGSILGGFCFGNTDCNPDSYCQRDSCDVTEPGTCAVRPTFCDNAPATVCGCDGVNYWNDCLRAFSGTTSSIPEECQYPVGCGGHEKRACPVANSSCARLVHDLSKCDPSDTMDFGFCWVLPPTCPVDLGQQWSSCPNAEAGAPDCVDTCDAIRTGIPHVPVMTCPPNP